MQPLFVCVMIDIMKGAENKVSRSLLIVNDCGQIFERNKVLCNYDTLSAFRL